MAESSNSQSALPKEDPFLGGEQGSLFQGGPSDASRAEPTQDAPGAKSAAEGPEQAQPSAKSEADVLRERVEAQDRLIERMIAGQGVPSQPPSAPAPALIPPGPAPDAVTKPVEFAQWLDKKLSYERALSEAGQAERDRRYDAANHLDRLWQSFQREYPAQSDDEDLVAAAFQKVVARNGGVMPSDSRVLFQGVAEQVDAWRGGAKKEPAAGRTNGLSPGTNRKGAKPAPPEPTKPTRFSDQLADLQLKTGFF